MTPRVSRLPYALLGAMTAFTLGGPLAIGYSLRGGPSPDWPPDRPVEWAVLLGTSGAVAVLMMACLALGFRPRKPGPRAPAPSEPGP